MMSGCLLYSPPDERQNYIQMLFSLNEEKLLVWYNHVLCLKKDGWFHDLRFFKYLAWVFLLDCYQGFWLFWGCICQIWKLPLSSCFSVLSVSCKLFVGYFWYLIVRGYGRLVYISVYIFLYAISSCSFLRLCLCYEKIHFII